MKTYYLSQNYFSKEYFLDEPEFDENRVSLGKIVKCEAFEQLKKILDFKREAIVYIVEPFDEKFESCLNSLFEGSKVKIEKVTRSE